MVPVEIFLWCPQLAVTSTASSSCGSAHSLLHACEALCVVTRLVLTLQGTEAQSSAEAHSRVWSQEAEEHCPWALGLLYSQESCCPQGPRGEWAPGCRLHSLLALWGLVDLSNTQCQNLGPVSCLCL